MPKSTKMVTTDRASQARRVVKALAKLYPDSHCALIHKNAYELIVATILSAQCTDVRVNIVTPKLFEKYPDAKTLAVAGPSDVEDLIRSTGFFRAKTKSLIGMAQGVVERHRGEIPNDLDALTKLPGVGRKTASVVLGNAFRKAEGVVVDTHVKRLSYRLGLTDQKTPEAIEQDLMANVPKKEWIDLSHRLIDHGRAVCKAISPRCSACELLKICPQRGVK